MCIAILKKPNGLINKTELETCFKNNPDMCGFAFAHQGKVHICKGYNNFEEFYSDYNKVASLNDRHILIHFRIATSGGINVDNCHPFYVHENKMALIHNGVISGMGATKVDNSKNDTRIFIEKYLTPFSSKMWYRKEFRDLISQAIGSYNKFVVLNHKDEAFIINEDVGHWECNCWLSNSSYKTVKVKKEYTCYTGNYWTKNNHIPSTKNTTTETEKKEEQKNETIKQDTSIRCVTYCDCCGDKIEYSYGQSKPQYCSECLDWARENGKKEYACNTCGKLWEGYTSFKCPECSSRDIETFKSASKNLNLLRSY